MDTYEISFDKPTQTIKAKVKGKLEEGDINRRIKPELVKIFKENSLINGALIDATEFEGWDEINELKEHFMFLKDYDERIHKIAIIANEVWKKALQAITVALETKVRVFGIEQIDEAQNWILKPRPVGARMQ